MGREEGKTESTSEATWDSTPGAGGNREGHAESESEQMEHLVNNSLLPSASAQTISLTNSYSSCLDGRGAVVAVTVASAMENP